LDVGNLTWLRERRNLYQEVKKKSEEACKYCPFLAGSIPKEKKKEANRHSVKEVWGKEKKVKLNTEASKS